jgi:hypothetical protein
MRAWCPRLARKGRQMLTARVDRKQVSGPRLCQRKQDRVIPPRIHRAMARAYSAEYREYRSVTT